jgi:hypothetical protein
LFVFVSFFLFVCFSVDFVFLCLIFNLFVSLFVSLFV